MNATQSCPTPDPALAPVIRTVTEPFEISQLRDLLDEQHYLGAGHPAGHVLWQGAWEHDPESGTDRVVAVFCWAGAAKCLKDRGKWIGWEAVTCANRLKLVVQLRRFVVVEAHRRPNLTSQCLGRALRGTARRMAASPRLHPFPRLELSRSCPPPEHPLQGHQLDPAGLHHRLPPPPRRLLSGPREPQATLDPAPPKERPRTAFGPRRATRTHRAGIAEATCGARCALPVKTLRSLRDALREVNDPRDPKSCRHPASAMLTLICFGLLCGAPDVRSIRKKCGPSTQQQRAAVGLTRRHPESRLLLMPGYDAFNDLLCAIGPAWLARALNRWLIADSYLLPKNPLNRRQGPRRQRQTRSHRHPLLPRHRRALGHGHLQRRKE